MDQRLLRLVDHHTSWNAIAADMQLGRNTVIERARRLGVAVRAKPAAAAELVVDDRSIDPLPAGHPISWGLLAALTPSIEARWTGFVSSP